MTVLGKYRISNQQYAILAWLSTNAGKSAADYIRASGLDPSCGAEGDPDSRAISTYRSINHLRKRGLVERNGRVPDPDKRSGHALFLTERGAMIAAEGTGQRLRTAPAKHSVSA